MRRTVLVDQDGVLGDFVTAFLSAYRRYGGCDAPDVVTVYDFIAPLPDQEAVAAAWADPCIWLSQVPYRGALEGLKALSEQNDVYVVTDPGPRPDVAAPAKLAWLEHHAPWLSHRRVIFTGHKELLRGDVLVEDRTANLLRWMRRNPDGRGYLVARTWNERRQHEVTNEGGCILHGELSALALPVVIS